MDINCPPYLPKPSLPIGIIPAGSTDTVAYCLNGTTDIKTSIIHIILGQSSGLDISSVYRNGSGENDGRQPQLLKLYASVMSYGFLGDVTMDSENYRWMGPKRYDYSGWFKTNCLDNPQTNQILLYLQASKSSSGTEVTT